MNLLKTASLTAGVLIHSEVLGRLSEEDFELFCQEQKGLRIERNEAGEMEIMAPTHSLGGRINAEVTRQLGNWNAEHQLGIVFDSATGFYVEGNSSGAMRSPDASFLYQQKFDSLAKEQKTGFLALCPDFVIEIKSGSDSENLLRQKMRNYLKYGASLGWLIFPEAEFVKVFRPDRRVEKILSFDSLLSAAPELPGFKLELSRLRMD